jgi:hypothetical protein
VLRRGYRGADDGGAVEKIEGVRYEPRRGWLKNGNPQVGCRKPSKVDRFSRDKHKRDKKHPDRIELPE